MPQRRRNGGSKSRAGLRRVIIAALAAPLGDVAWAEGARWAERLDAASGKIEQADSIARQADEKVRFGFTATACTLVQTARIRYSMAAMDLITLKQEIGDQAERTPAALRERLDDRLAAANGNVAYASAVLARDCTDDEGHGH